MHIHVSKKMLETTQFSIEKNGDDLNIKGYHADQVEACERCSLKSFKSNETINIKNLTEKECSCKLSISPLLSFKVNAKETENITLV